MTGGWPLERVLFALAGTMVALSAVLTVAVSSWFLLLAGFVVLMMLMVTVIYNDLTRISWLERLMPWRN